MINGFFCSVRIIIVYVYIRICNFTPLYYIISVNFITIMCNLDIEISST